MLLWFLAWIGWLGLWNFDDGRWRQESFFLVANQWDNYWHQPGVDGSVKLAGEVCDLRKLLFDFLSIEWQPLFELLFATGGGLAHEAFELSVLKLTHI